VSRVAHSTETGLGGSLVAAGLQSDLTVSARLDLPLREVALVLLRHLRSDRRSLVLGVLLSSPSQGEQAQGHLRNIPGLEQVWGLEDLLVRDSVLLDGAQEGLHVLHQEEGGALLLELGNGVRCDLVDEPAEYDPVLEYVGVVPLGQRLLQHRRDPLHDFLFLFRVPGSHLCSLVEVNQAILAWSF